MNDKALAAQLGIVSLFFTVAILAVFLIAHTPERKIDFEMQANCIEEYVYTHPENPIHDNLIAGLKECRPDN